MKRLIVLLIMLMTSVAWAQFGGINYKAIIKDMNGNVAANQTIGLQFNIIQGSGGTAPTVYSEDHNVLTNSEGVAIAVIGKGTPSIGLFDDIDWGSDDHYLNIVYDDFSGATPVDLGTVQFNTVPYALDAKNVSGLEALDEGNGIGWRLKGSDPDNFGDIGINAVDLTYTDFPSSQIGATGITSFTSGLSTTASGAYSIAMGRYAIASGNDAIAIGGESNATFASAIAIGNQTNSTAQGALSMGTFASASGLFSLSMGFDTNSPVYRSTVMGSYNLTPGGSGSFWNGVDPIFEIGNGETDALRSNALTVLKNGTILAPTFDLAEIADPKSLITKEYADTNAASGLEALDEGNGIGWRLKGKNPNNYGVLGEDATDLSESEFNSTTKGATGLKSSAMGSGTTASGIIATAMGDTTTASGDRSTALGDNTTASGLASTAMGFLTTSSGNRSTAMGNITTASGSSSFAMGSGTTASGNYSTALGISTEANAYVTTAIGRYNLGSAISGTSWEINDPLFEIGNGTSNSNRNTAFRVLKSGAVFIKSQQNGLWITEAAFDGIVVQGADGIGGFFTGAETGLKTRSSNNNNPDLILSGTNGTATGDDGIISSDPTYSGSDIFLRSYDAVVINLDYDNNETGQFEIKAGDGTEIFEVDESGTIRQNGATIHASDRRLKKDISDLPYGLTEILALDPKIYNWKNNTQSQKSLGLIAQDVEKIISEIVNVKDDEAKTLGISYTELIPVLINAIKEQQEIIDDQKKEILYLSANAIKRDQSFNLINERLNQLEKKINQ